MSEPVTVKILDREFLIACTPEERPGLIAAAGYLDGKMRDMRNRGASGLDRIAVLAALNIAHELLTLQQARASDASQLAQHLLSLKSRLDAALPASLQ
ncbi:cell division protein ZapA [Dokdonella koreensis]|uniref:Cell division protein ZapA n=1 Tax=Dokdonella koreensis DS-123 TaxID=1300342 RepID=A0A160DSV2_9GAMM|nr:cell division protein ZapA [Dokdonella koreensis]ANB17000.1 Cell division protein ZapA [Dokdonella koreensis DS-123]